MTWSWLYAPWTLLALASLVWLAPASARRAEAPWRTGLDLGLAGLLAVAGPLLAGAWLARFYLIDFPLTATDFSQYCQSVASLRDGTLVDWVPQRGVAAGYLPSLLARALGVIDGLIAASLVSFGVLCAALYLWGRAVHGRLAGVSACLLAVSMKPLAILTRTTTFYPETTAIFALSAAGAAAALRWRTWPALLAGGVGAGLALLIDVRGLFWGLSALGLTVLAALPGAPRRLPLRLALAILPVVASWWLGRFAFLGRVNTLEQQMFDYVQDAVRFAGLQDQVKFPTSISAPAFHSPYSFVWGYSHPLHLPHTFRWLIELRRHLPEDLGQHFATVRVRRALLDPWFWPSTAGLLLILSRLRRQLWALLALVGTLVPFVLALQSAATLVVHARYLANGMVALALICGLAWAMVFEEPLLTRRLRREPAPGQGATPPPEPAALEPEAAPALEQSAPPQPAPAPIVEVAEAVDTREQALEAQLSPPAPTEAARRIESAVLTHSALKSSRSAPARSRRASRLRRAARYAWGRAQERLRRVDPAAAARQAGQGATSVARQSASLARGLAGAAFAAISALSRRALALARAVRDLPWPPWTRAVAGAALLLLLVAGLVPSWLSPAAPWRHETYARVGDEEPYRTLDQAANAGAQIPPSSTRCIAALREDHARGLPYGSRIYAVEVPVKSP